MKKLLKNKLSEAKGAVSKYTAQQLITVCVVSVFIVLVSASAVFGLNTNQEIVNYIEAEQAENAQNLQAKQATEKEDSVDGESNLLGSTNTSMMNAQLDTTATWKDDIIIDWYPNYTSTTKTYTTNIHYGGLAYATTSPTITYQDKYEPITPFINYGYGQYAQHLRRDYPISTSVLTGSNAYRTSHWDVRYFEETYKTDGDSHTWAYSGSFIEVTTATGKTRYPMTKFAIYNNNLCYMDDLSNGTWTTNISLTNATSIDVYILFKEFTDLGDASVDSIDSRTYWEKTETETTNHYAIMQYMYYDPEDTGGTTFKHMDPPFAGDVYLDSTDKFTFSNFSGRYVKEKVWDTGEHKYRDEEVEATYQMTAIAVPYGAEGGTQNWIQNVEYIYWDSSNTRWRYRIVGENQDKTLNEYGTETKYTGQLLWVNIIYNSDKQYTTPGLSNDNITINIFDYDVWAESGDNVDFPSRGNPASWTLSDADRFLGGLGYDYSTNKQFPFAFGGDPYHWTIPWNDYTDGKYVRRQFASAESGDYEKGRGIVKNNLVNGYPEMVDTYYQRWNMTSSGSSNYQRYGFDVKNNFGSQNLSYLFGNEAEDDSIFRRRYSNLTGLFDAKVYEETGYFVYGSKDVIMNGAKIADGHFAQIRKKPDNSNNITNEELNNSFVLFNEETSDNAKFMPFDDYGNTGSANHDFHFGMTIETKFMQPKDGQSTTGSQEGPMVFHFNGDDDVWVFVDGVLMLDLGGVHQNVRGDINFATGLVSYYENGNETTPSYTIYMDEMYAIAYKDQTGEDWDKTKDPNWEPVSDAAGAHYRYADWTSHTFNFYYLERGTGESNCEIAFNLQTMPPGSVRVDKQVDTGDYTGYLDGDFNYKVEVQEYDEETKTYGEWIPYTYDAADPELSKHTYDVYDVNSPLMPIASDVVPEVRADDPNKYGIIKLKKDQFCYIKGFSTLDKFKVSECDPSGTITGETDLLWTVQYNFNDREAESWITPEEKIVYIDGSEWWGADALTAGDGEQNAVFFKNSINSNSLFDLIIKKRESNGDTSNIIVGFNGETDEATHKPVSPELYNGKYDLHKADGTTVYTDLDCTDGKISLEDGDWVVIHNVQMRSRASVQLTNEGQSASYATMQTTENPGTSFEAGQMYDSYPILPYSVEAPWSWYKEDTNLYAARVPFVNPLPADTTKRYSEIDFLAKNIMSNLVLKKIVEDAETELGRTYDIGLTLYKNSAEPLVPYSSDDTFTAYLYSDEANEPVKYDAKIIDGSIKIRVADTEGEFVNTKLKKDEYLEIENILPTDAETTSDKVKCYIANEEVIADCTPTAYLDDVSTSAHEMNEIKDGYKYSTQIDTDSASKDTIIIKNKFGDVPPTAYNIMKNPELWTLLLAALMLVGLAAPIEIIRKGRARRLLRALPTLNIGTDRFEI